MDVSVDFNLESKEAIEFFQSKGLKQSFSWADMVGDEHDAAFTVAKMMDTDLLTTVQSKLSDALENGTTLQQFKNELIPTLQAAGWWGKKDVVDKLTGKIVKAQLGSASRLETIFRSNLQSAYAVGHWDKINLNSKTAPYLMYDAVDDHRVRPEHAARDGQVYPISSPFWKTHYPPNGWNCRCGVVQLDEDDLADMDLKPINVPKIETRKWVNPRTGTVQDIPVDVDPGWNHNPGIARQKTLAQTADDKAQAMLNSQQQAAHAIAIQKQAAARAAYKKQLTQDQELAALNVKKTAAADDISNALASNTPYLAKEIKALQEKNPGMSAIDLLDAAKVKALKAEQNSMVQSWKKTSKLGKEPTPKAQAHFETLPPDVQAAMKLEVKTHLAQQSATSELLDIGAGSTTPSQKQAYDELLQAGVPADIKGDIVKTVALIKKNANEIEKGIESKAVAQLQEILAGEAAAQPALQKKVLQKIDASNQEFPSNQALLDEFKIQLVAAQANKQKIDAVFGYKKKVLAGKIPTPVQQQVFNGLDDIEKVKILDEIDKKKAKQPKPIATNVEAKINTAPPEAPVAPTAASSPEADIDVDSLTQIGPQGGSNPGGLFQDSSTGTKWYIKEPKSLDAGRNEVLAGKFYEAAGIDVPEMKIIAKDGKDMIASKIIDGLESNRALLVGNTEVPGVADGYLVDAWLGNWDVVGQGYDNLLIKADRAIRVDTGGALRYRAQGALKHVDDFGTLVKEITSLRDGSFSQTTAVFGNLSREQLIESARRVAQFTDDKIDDLLLATGPLDKGTRDALAATLKARRDHILREFPEAKTQRKPSPVVTGEAVTRLEQENVTNSRSNGYTIATDKDQIEDQNVLLWHKTDIKGERSTNAYFKIRGDIEEALQNELPASAQVQKEFNLAAPKQAFTDMAKGIGHQHANNLPFRDKDIARLESTANAIEAAIEGLEAGLKKKIYKKTDVDNALAGLNSMQVEIKWMAAQAKEGQPAVGWRKFLDPNKEVGSVLEILDGKPVTPPRKWIAGKTDYTVAEARRGHITETDRTYAVSSDAYTTKIGDVEVKYWPDQPSVLFALRGRVQIQVPGDKQINAARVFEIMEELGIDSKRAADKDIELLYLQQIAYANKLDTKPAYKKARQAGDVEAAKAYLSGELDIDLASSPHYKPHGERQAFEHGRRTRYRPELLGHKDWPAFEKDHKLIHEVYGGDMVANLGRILEGGGQMAPTSDKIRRGIAFGGQSPESDLDTGGASYFFTRIQTTKTASRGEKLVWSSRVAARNDAISYDGDKYGETKGTHVQDNRKFTIEQLKAATRNHKNETIIKDSLSIFDGLESIQVDSSTKQQAIIKLFQNAGYKVWPDGRPLDQVIVQVL